MCKDAIKNMFIIENKGLKDSIYFYLFKIESSKQNTSVISFIIQELNILLCPHQMTLTTDLLDEMNNAFIEEK